ncbi:MAG: gamma-glutamylcyclotransferase [Pseudomonadota bacterium]
MMMWVFGYGSLLWNPGFDAAESVVARLDGYARSFCMRSIHHRGSEADPGLVLALDAAPGASCTGLALAVRAREEDRVLADLRARELISSAYYEDHVPLALEDGRRVDALAYIINRDHRQYCGGLPLEEQAQIIATATGGRGPNRDYLFNTEAHLQAMGLGDADLTWLAARVRALCG